MTRRKHIQVRQQTYSNSKQQFLLTTIHLKSNVVKYCSKTYKCDCITHPDIYWGSCSSTVLKVSYLATSSISTAFKLERCGLYIAAMLWPGFSFQYITFCNAIFTMVLSTKLWRILSHMGKPFPIFKKILKQNIGVKSECWKWSWSWRPSQNYTWSCTRLHNLSSQNIKIFWTGRISHQHDNVPTLRKEAVHHDCLSTTLQLVGVLQ